jgi:hypothetical protein
MGLAASPLRAVAGGIRSISWTPTRRRAETVAAEVANPQEWRQVTPAASGQASWATRCCARRLVRHQRGDRQAARFRSSQARLSSTSPTRLTPPHDGLATTDSLSAEDVASPAGRTRVVGAFNTYAGTSTKGEAGLPLMSSSAGDDAEAKEKVAQIVKDGGMRPIDTGPLSRPARSKASRYPHRHPGPPAPTGAAPSESIVMCWGGLPIPPEGWARTCTGFDGSPCTMPPRPEG